MKNLEFKDGIRVFTYKVAHDGGSAPNPYHGVCTLAICKPAIRNSAKVDDIVIGIVTGDSRRIVYCMQVTDVLPWSEYIALCRGKHESNGKIEYKNIGKKIPKDEHDPGDCIWKMVGTHHAPLESHSGHDEGDYERDIGGNKSVLLSTKFWYFGKGKNSEGGYDLKLPDYMPMVNRGHLSNKNHDLREQFVKDFAELLKNEGVTKDGRRGDPAIRPGSDREACARCRREEIESDAVGEE